MSLTKDQVLMAVSEVMEVPLSDLPGKTNPLTKPRLHWARNMLAYVMRDYGFTENAIAAASGYIHRGTVVSRQNHMARKLETSSLYRSHYIAILNRLDAVQQREAV